MVTQREVIKQVCRGVPPSEIRDPSGMKVFNPNNIGVKAVVTSQMSSYRRRLGRDQPWPVIIAKLSDGMVLFASGIGPWNYIHKQKARRVGGRFAPSRKMSSFDESHNPLIYKDGLIYEEISRGNIDVYVPAVND